METASVTYSVIKRDGVTVQPYNRSKIINAVEAAWREFGTTPDTVTLNKVADTVSERVEVLAKLDNNTVDVEHIQDLVEMALMKHGHFDIAKAYIVFRSKRQEVRKTRLHPDSSAISDYIHPSKYGRYIEDLKRRELFSETADRSMQMHINKFKDLFAKDPGLEKDIRWAFDKVKNKEVLPSGRSSQFAGKAIEVNNCRSFNCSFTLMDRPKAFSEILFMLLCGCGVGYSVQFEHVEKLPIIKEVDKKLVRHHIIDDTIEGWSNALDALITGHIRGYYVEFSYHRIRDAGEPLKTSGGVAPGHAGLKVALERIRGILTEAAGRRLRPVEVSDVVMHAADAVLSGGIRRSSCIALFSLEDGEMMNSKATSDWFTKHPWRANANISVAIKRDEIKKKSFKRIFNMTKMYGEPGFIFVNSPESGYNPCLSVTTKVLTPTGVSTINDIEVGYTIWSGKRWTKVTNKWKTGVKLVYDFVTSGGTFRGTDNHRVVSNGVKIEVGLAKSIDFAYNPVNPKPFDQQTYEILSKNCIGSEVVYDITVDDEDHVFWSDNLLVSNCGEVNLNPVLTITPEVLEMIKVREANGKWHPKVKLGDKFTGFQVCNLVELNAAKFTDLDSFMSAAKAGTIIATMQASYTEMEYLGWVSELINEREALIGVGMTGIMDSPDVALNPENQRKVATSIVKWNKEYAKRIGIRQSARSVVIKPSGTSSLLLGGTASGIHPHHARRYIRRVTANALEPVFLYFKSINPHMCQKKNNGDWVIEFPVEAPDGAKVKSDVGAIEFLEIVRSTQQNWVLPGTGLPDSSPGFNNNVSNTVIVKDDEWEAVSEYMWEKREEFTCVSFLPSIGDKLYSFAPLEEITTEADEAKWNYLLKSYKPVDYSKMYEDEDGTNRAAEPSCVGGACAV